MNEEEIHIVCLTLKPAVGVEGVAVFAKQRWIPVVDPRVDAQNCLGNSLVNIQGSETMHQLTPSSKYLSPMVIPPLGTTRWSGLGTAL